MIELSNVSLSSNVSSLSAAETNVYMILQNLNDISNSFVNIAFYLSEISRRLQFKDFGFDNIVDFALAAFGFNKSMTYGLISIRDGFMNGDRLKDKYIGFSQSQLMEMSSIRYDSMINRIAASDTVASIRRYKKAYHYCNNKDYKAWNYTRLAKTVPEFLSLFDEYMSSASPKDDGKSIECSNVDSGRLEKSEDLEKTLTELDKLLEDYQTPITSPQSIIEATSIIKKDSILPCMERLFVCQWDSGIKFFRRYFDTLDGALSYAKKVLANNDSPHVYCVDLCFLDEYNV